MPTAPRHRRALLLTLVIGAAFAAVAIWPQLIGAQRWQIVAPVISFRALWALGLGAVALAAALVAVVRRRAAVALGLAIVLGAASLGNAAVLLARGGGGSLSAGDLTVAVWNTYGGGAPPEAIARLVRETGADVVSLPETDADAAAEVVGILDREGIAMTAATVQSDDGDAPIPTSLLIARDLGTYVHDAAAGSTPGLPSGVWRPADGTGPTLIAAHPVPPFPEVWDSWAAGLDWVAQQCTGPDVILAGDLNSTLDHLSGLGRDGGVVGGCQDAAQQAGAAARGTWPVSLPTALAAPIDHVLVGSGWNVLSFDVRTDFDDAGSDHRPVVAVLSRR